MPFKIQSLVFLTFVVIVNISCADRHYPKTKNSSDISLPEEKSNLMVSEKEGLKVTLTSAGIGNIQSGDDLRDLQKKGLLKKDVLITGEGKFPIWNIRDQHLGNIGYVMEHPMLEGKVGDIFITSDAVKTENGLKVGSTWADLKKMYPDIDAHGSEIEGIVTASVDGYNYRLDIRDWSYEIEEGKLKPDTKFDLIWLGHHLVNNTWDLNVTTPDHYICFLEDKDSTRRLWIGYTFEERAILVKFEGEAKTRDLIFEKEIFKKEGAYPTIISHYQEKQGDVIKGEYKITHSGNWDYVEYQPEKGGKKFKYTIDHDANPYGKEPCF